MSTPVAELIAPALERYGKALDEHGHASAARLRASKAYDVEVDLLLEDNRR